MADELLKLDDIQFNYGSIKALKGISLTVHRGEIVTLIGANGAGKTTTMRVISGLGMPGAGRVFYKGTDITRWDAQKRVRSGIVQVPEGRQVFPDLTVDDNLEMGGYLQRRKTNEVTLEQVHELFPILKTRRRQYAGTLSGGEQQMLAVARALMSRPELLLLDEPSMGLAPKIVKELFALIARINEMDTTILLVEQNAKAALKISNRAYLIETGHMVMDGTSAAFLSSDTMKKAYLGL